MTDLATLGLAVDSSQVRMAAADLRNLNKEAGEAEKAMKGVGKAANEQASAFAKAKGPAAEFARSFAALDEASGSYDKTTNKIINSLANMYARLTLNGKALAQYNVVSQMGAGANEGAVENIAKVTGALYEMAQAQQATADAARQAGATFRADLEARLGLADEVAKSAKYSAQVFSEELSRLDGIASARTKQAGSNFTQSLEASLGIVGVVQKSASESASASLTW